MEVSNSHLLTWEMSSQPRRRVTIDMLPNDVLLEIFDSVLDTLWRNTWHRLAHVCQKWRKIVFSAPRRLNLELMCKDGKPVRNTLYVWPPFPIKMCYYCVKKSSGYTKYNYGEDVDNIIAALEHKDRVCEMNLLNAPSSEMEEMLAAMQEPFPALITLNLRPKSTYTGAPVIRVFDSFLGGSAPLLRTLCLDHILLPFLGLQKLLLSASGLNKLHLTNIPDSAYFSPDAIVTCLSALTRLEDLEITFKSSRSRPVRESRHPPPLTLILLPALTSLTFKGVSEYLEDLVAQIDTPRLQTLSITFFHQLIFHTPQLSRLISRAPRLKGYDEARVSFTYRDAQVTLRLPLSKGPIGQEISVGISCKRPDLQHLSLVQLCTSSFPQGFIPAVKHLYLEYEEEVWGDGWENNTRNEIPNSQWLQLLHPFIAVKNMYIFEKVAPLIAPALQELVGERVTEVLPALECLFLDGLGASGSVRDAIWPFIDARQLSTHPVVASYWDCNDED